jgi:hypothetical protein
VLHDDTILTLDVTPLWCHSDAMTEWISTEELRAQFYLPRSRRTAGWSRDRDVARMLSPRRRHGAGPDSVVRGG